MPKTALWIVLLCASSACDRDDRTAARAGTGADAPDVPAAEDSSSATASASSSCSRPTLSYQVGGQQLPLYVEESGGSSPTKRCEARPVEEADGWVVVRHPGSAQLATKVALFQIRPRLTAVAGVASVELVTGTESRAVVRVDARLGAQRGLGAADVTAALTKPNFELPAGRIETQGREISVRAMDPPDDVAALRGVVVGVRGGATVRLGDIATVGIESHPVSSFRLPPPHDDAQAVLALRLKSDAPRATRLEDLSLSVREMARELPPELSATFVFAR